MRSAVIVPAYQAAGLVGPVVEELVRIWPDGGTVFVVDDGSTDGTSEVAERAGGKVLRHAFNRGKGAALRTGLRAAKHHGYDVVVTVDADGQHPPEEALRMHQAVPDPGALVVGVRDLEGAGAPRANQMSNRFSNIVISGFAGHRFGDTQSGLRRYPIDRTLALGGGETGYGYEAEILLLATASGVPVIDVPIRVIYPPEEERLSHFDAVRDPARIVWRVVSTVAITRSRALVDAFR